MKIYDRIQVALFSSYIAFKLRFEDTLIYTTNVNNNMVAKKSLLHFYSS